MHSFRMKILFVLFLCGGAFSLRCFEGKLLGLENNTRTDEKDCGGISHYCIQRINRLKSEISRECSSWSDEHSMEEKCPMAGCHWQSTHETFCCCQFDKCNEWKADGTEYKKGETIPREKKIYKIPQDPPSSLRPVTIFNKTPTNTEFVNIETTQASKGKSTEINLN